MAEAAIPAAVPTGSSSAARLLRAVARQRELSLVVVMVVLGAFVFTQAPQFLSASNLTQVTAHASIIAVAAVGEAIVILTRNVDLSIEAMIGLVAFAVADILASRTVGAPVAILLGVGLGLVLGLLNGVLVARPPGAGDHRDARHAVGLSRLHAAAGRRQADHADPAAGRLHRLGPRDGHLPAAVRGDRARSS